MATNPHAIVGLLACYPAQARCLTLARSLTLAGCLVVLGMSGLGVSGLGMSGLAMLSAGQGQEAAAASTVRADHSADTAPAEAATIQATTIQATTTQATTTTERPKLPNIIVLLADDLGQGDPRCYNPDSKTPTPCLDQLATEGMRFTDAHSPSAVCTPTRYGLLTGRYCWRTPLKRGVLGGFSPQLIEPGRETIASLLQQAGYHTAVIGKWHLGLGSQQQTDYAQPLRPGPRDVGFDYCYVIPASLDIEPYLWVENDRAVEQPTLQDPGSKRVWEGGQGFWRPGPRAPSFRHAEVLPKIVEKSVAYIEERAEQQQPFFLYVPFSSPHTPWLPTEQYVGKSQAEAYGDFVCQTDAAMGEILATLARHGLTQQTLVIATSDNGSHWLPEMIEKYQHQANNGLRGMKADIHEGGHRVPLVVRYPGRITAGSLCSHTVCLTDIMATAADVSGQELSPAMAEDSFNLWPLLTAQTTEPVRQTTIFHSGNGTFAIREGDWKLIEGNLGSGGFTRPGRVEPSPDGPAGQLYHLGDDPQETTNLYQQQPERVERLLKQLEQIRAQGFSRPIQ